MFRERESSVKLLSSQNDFIYAVWEWLFKECAIHAGFVDANDRPDYEKDGQPYNGECTQDGFLSFISQMQAIYTDTTFGNNPNLYVSRAQQEHALWGNDTTNPYRYNYGQCPCVWGDVGYEIPEDAPNQNEREMVARRNGGNPTINNGWSFSYFARDSSVMPDPDHKYFKVY